MPGPLDADRLAAWRAFLTAHRHLVDRLAAELAEDQDLPLAWYDVLVNLDEADGDRLRMADLADRILLSQSGLTRLVDRMGGAGFVSREQCPTDRRGTFVVLTPEGRAALHRAAPVHLSGVAAHFGDLLSDEEARVLRDALDRVAGTLAGGA
jgi:DNA-binding MarR family transcriptional regulator